MIGRLAVRSLTAHPVRSAVLAAGFGVGVAVMAILLGVAQIVLEQSRAPALVGGGDVLIRLAPQVPGTAGARGRAAVRRASTRVSGRPRRRTPHAVSSSTTDEATRVAARGGIPSLERALGDDEVADDRRTGSDSPDDIAWTQDTPEKVLRYIDRFHPIPDVPDMGRLVGGVAVLQRPRVRAPASI